MSNNFIKIILKDNTNNFNLNDNETLNFIKISLGKNANNFNNPYISNENIRDSDLIKFYDKKKSSEQNLEIIYYKKYIKSNIGKMIYKNMKYNLIPIKLKSKNNINLNNNKIFELIKLSFGNNIIQLNYNKNKKEFSKANLEIINFKIYLEKNIGKMKYKSIDIFEEIKLFDKIFLLYNIKRAKIIINNKEYTLKEYIFNKKQVLKIKIKFLDNIIHLNSMFSGCISLLYVYNFQNLNTKYTKTICKLFKDCSSLLYIEDISYLNEKNINDISKILCSSFSKWNTSNVIDMYF